MKISLLDAVMSQSSHSEPERGGQYLIFSVQSQGVLLRERTRDNFLKWSIAKYENVDSLDDIMWQVLQTPYHPDRVYLVYGETSFLDTHGTRWRPHVWQGWRDDPPLGLHDIIDGNNSAAASNLWWSITECTEGLSSGPTYSIENPARNVYLGVEGDDVWAYQKPAGMEPAMNCQWLFVPINNINRLRLAIEGMAA